MSGTIIKTGKEFRFSKSRLDVVEELPVGNYLLKFSQKDLEYYLEESDSFTIPDKVYGESYDLAERYLNTFKNNSGNLGILLTGVKGTGKSLLAKMVCTKANIPVILITQGFIDNELKSFLNKIKQEVIIFLDEFEKTYRDSKHQEIFLSLLDGVFEGKKMYILTSNVKNNVSTYLLNRPSRIHYLKQYDSLDKSVIEEIIDDRLNARKHKKELMKVLNIVGMVTVDMLMSLINEMNMYNEDPKKAISMLNIKPETANYKVEVYEIERKIGGKFDEEFLGSSHIWHHPLSGQELRFNYVDVKTQVQRGINFSLDESEIDIDGDIITINNDKYRNKNLRIVCTPKVEYNFNFYGF